MVSCSFCSGSVVLVKRVRCVFDVIFADGHVFLPRVGALWLRVCLSVSRSYFHGITVRVFSLGLCPTEATPWFIARVTTRYLVLFGQDFTCSSRCWVSKFYQFSTGIYELTGLDSRRVLVEEGVNYWGFPVEIGSHITVFSTWFLLANTCFFHVTGVVIKGVLNSYLTSVWRVSRSCFHGYVGCE